MEDCIFCKITSGAISSDIVYQDEHFVAFRDIHPQAPVHVLIAPRRHWPDLLAMAADAAGPAVARYLPAAVAGTARACGIEASGFRIISNCGKDGGQSVPHVHFHLLGGTPLGDKIR